MTKTMTVNGTPPAPEHLLERKKWLNGKSVNGKCEMRSYFKSELARAAGVSMRTFSQWLSQNTLLLAELGGMPHAKLIPARAAHRICGQYGIDEGEL